MPATSTWDGHAVWEVCPVCDANIYDNREQIETGDAKYASGKRRPVFKCSDRDCGWAVWPAKKPKRSDGSTPHLRDAQPPATRPRQGGFSELHNLFRLYKVCLEEVVRRYSKTWAGKHPAEVVAAVATLFIQAARANIVLPAPPAPKPDSHSEPEPEYEDGPPPLDDDDEVPF